MATSAKETLSRFGRKFHFGERIVFPIPDGSAEYYDERVIAAAEGLLPLFNNGIETMAGFREHPTVFATSAVNKRNSLARLLSSAGGIGPASDCYMLNPPGPKEEDQGEPPGIISARKLVKSLTADKLVPVAGIPILDPQGKVIHEPPSNPQLTLAGLRRKTGEPIIYFANDTRYSRTTSEGRQVLPKPDSADLVADNLREILGGEGPYHRHLLSELGITIAIAGQLALIVTLYHNLTLKRFDDNRDRDSQSGKYFSESHLVQQAPLFTGIAGGISMGQVMSRDGLKFVHGYPFEAGTEESIYLAYIVDQLAKGAPHALLALLGLLNSNEGVVDRTLVLRNLLYADLDVFTTQIPKSISEPLAKQLDIPRNHIYQFTGLPKPEFFLATLQAVRQRGLHGQEANPDQTPRIYSTDKGEYPQGYISLQ